MVKVVHVSFHCESSTQSSHSSLVHLLCDTSTSLIGCFFWCIRHIDSCLLRFKHILQQKAQCAFCLQFHFYKDRVIFRNCYSKYKKSCWLSVFSIVRRTSTKRPEAWPASTYRYLRGFRSIRGYWQEQFRPIRAYWPKPSQISVGAGWPCLLVLAFCAGKLLTETRVPVNYSNLFNMRTQ